MTEIAAQTRTEAIERFAEVLRDLRESVGSPSFREMAGRSKAISHTTLHEAAQGHRFPSWPTTCEFVKACGADPNDYRARWDEANRLVHSPEVPTFVTKFESEPPPPEVGPSQSGRAERPGRRVLWAILATVVVVVAIAAAAGLVRNRGGSADQADPWATPMRNTALTETECPVVPTNPPPAPPLHSGDEPRFIADVTLPDCTHVAGGTTVLKVWRLKNIGTVPWKDYTLRRLDLPQDRTSCQTITDVPIADTDPGGFVDIKVEVVTPKRPTFCYVRFKMLDASGQIAFPGNRPVNFQVIVD